MKNYDVKVKDASVVFLPVETRVPLKFGRETVTHITCARVKITVENAEGATAEGWGETPLSVTWVWPCKLTYEERERPIREFVEQLAKAWPEFEQSGHAMEVGHAFNENKLPALLEQMNAGKSNAESMPWLAALVCNSAFDIALHDAYGMVNQIPIYDTYNNKYMNKDLSHYITPADNSSINFAGKYPEDYLIKPRPNILPAWHLVGGKDLISKNELTGSEPDDGYPVLLDEWIKRDGLKCLKIKLSGTDTKWDYQRLVDVGRIAINLNTPWLTTDFNCTVTKPAYVNDILDRLVKEEPRIYGMILYVEQPFPYELEENRIDVHSVSARKPLFMDESAHDWNLIKLGRSLGWTGVALKTCKTQTGALLSLCWAKAHGMTLMVQDLTNPMLAQIPHCLLAAHAGTIMGVETNAMQFYPDASKAEEKVHPGLYRRRNGCLDLSTIKGNGFGYCLNKIKN